MVGHGLPHLLEPRARGAEAGEDDAHAHRARPAGGRIRLEVGKAAEGQVRLVLADTGPGISPENLANIFEPFFSRKPDGTGLGLATTARIVEDHKGSIEVKSQLGRGTIFTIRLPAVLMP